MDALTGFLEYFGSFAVGIFARLGFVFVAMLAILIPALAVYLCIRLVEVIRRQAQGLQLAGGLLYRPGLLYATGHTWARPERGGMRVGVDDLVHRLLPWAVSVRLPEPGATLRAGEPAAVISAGDREAVINAPFDGTVTAVNANVVIEPSLVKHDGYSRGWLFSMKPASEKPQGLRTGDEALAWLASEGDRLHRWLETRLGIAAADGGELIHPVTEHLDEEEWKALTKSFLG